MSAAAPFDVEAAVARLALACSTEEALRSRGPTFSTESAGGEIVTAYRAVEAERDALRRRLAEADRNLQGERSSREREQRKAWNLDAQLAVTRGALRGALEAVPALEARRDELLRAANRYLASLRFWKALARRDGINPHAPDFDPFYADDGP